MQTNNNNEAALVACGAALRCLLKQQKAPAAPAAGLLALLQVEVLRAAGLESPSVRIDVRRLRRIARALKRAGLPSFVTFHGPNRRGGRPPVFLALTMGHKEAYESGDGADEDEDDGWEAVLKEGDDDYEEEPGIPLREFTRSTKRALLSAFDDDDLEAFVDAAGCNPSTFRALRGGLGLSVTKLVRLCSNGTLKGRLEVVLPHKLAAMRVIEAATFLVLSGC